MTNDERNGFASLARFTANGRELVRAVHHFAAADRRDMFPELLRIAYRFGVIQAVVLLRDLMGMARMDGGLTHWFSERGAFWFDVYRRGNLAYVRSEDAELQRRFARDGNEILARAIADPNLGAVRKQLLQKLVSGDDPIVRVPVAENASIDARFRRYCDDHGLAVVRLLQTGVRGLNRCSWVFLVQDADGIMKVFKELPSNRNNRLGRLPSETDIYARLGVDERFPRHQGMVDIGEGVTFSKLSVCYGQNLSDYAQTGNRLAPREVCAVVGRLADALARVHASGILHLDLRPENVALTPDGIGLFDFNASRFAEEGGVDAFPYDPRYAAPETALQFRASAATDVFALGAIFHLLATGEHPFAGNNELTDDRAAMLERYGLANAFAPYGRKLETELGEPRLAVIARMLEKDPAQRPSMAEVAALLATEATSLHLKGRRSARPRERNTVLFPARMGIPHKGHIDYIVRLLELGFYPVISLQHSYTSTDLDPLPKWVVMKMVARSLLDLGFDRNDFAFVFTPFYETRQRLQAHFAMMPNIENVVAVASGNPEIHRLFPHNPIIDQKAVFGCEGENYEVRSWGEILRKAVRENDLETFGSYTASGVERIMPFDELRSRYNEMPIEFVKGAVKFALQVDGATVEGKVRNYLSPEEWIIRSLQDRGEEAMIVDPYCADTVIARNGKTALLRYEYTVPEGDDIVLNYRII